MLDRTKGISLAIPVAALLALAYASYLAIAFADQALLDLHGFRQTQTALTSYWFIHDGFRLAYETPVVGAPFAIPFEFPIYQALVAVLAMVPGLPLEVAGRLTSFAFLVLCLVPARSITRNLRLPSEVGWLFVALLFSSPVYVYWGRSFMVETAALFFSLSAIAFFVDFLSGARSVRSLLLFAVFATLAVLQKSTTWLPVVPVLGIAYLGVEGRRCGSVRALVLARRAWLVAAGFVLPIVVGYAWVRYTDQVKMLNPLGRHLTSAALAGWNFGSLEQRWSGEIWTTVFLNRLLGLNFASLLALPVLLAPFVVRTQARVRWIVAAALALALLPLFVFTNLHLVHSYYQSANAIFLVFAVAVALGAAVLPRIGAAATTLVFAILLVGNYQALDEEYLGVLKVRFTPANRNVAVGEILRREVPADRMFVAFGNDWSSTFAYVAQRKSLMVPRWFEDYAGVAATPERYVAPGSLGAVVWCFPGAADTNRLAAWASQGRAWKIGFTHQCLIAVPEKALDAAVEPASQCAGGIEGAEVQARTGRRMLSVAGWTALEAARATVPEHVFVSVAAAGAPVAYFDTLEVPRLEKTEASELEEGAGTGFSRLIPGEWRPGEYELGVVQYAGGRYQACPMKKRIVVR